jgi:hypothetical protein
MADAVKLEAIAGHVVSPILRRSKFSDYAV